MHHYSLLNLCNTNQWECNILFKNINLKNRHKYLFLNLVFKMSSIKITHTFTHYNAKLGTFVKYDFIQHFQLILLIKYYHINILIPRTLTP